MNFLKHCAVIIGIILLILILALVFWQLLIKEKNVDQQVLGGDKDAHGCIGSAGYSWCEAKQKCLRIWEEDCLPSGFGNSNVKKAIIDYLLTQNNFSWKTTDGSQNFCDIENLQPKNELFPFYVWVYCAEYTLEDGKLKTQSGTSMPVKINYPNELSFYDLSKFSYEAPRDGTYNGPDIEKIFPEDAQRALSSFDKQIIIKRVETLAYNNILAWELIKQSINNCEAEKVFQTHSRVVTLNLKNGDKLTAIEPEIDNIMIVVDGAVSKCGRIIVGTE